MKKWNITSVYNSKESVLSQLLKARGFDTQSKIDEFLTPPKISYYINNLDAEFKKSLLDAKKIIDACRQKIIPIVIHGDYDADGIASTAILYNTIKDELNYKNVYYFIPNRFDHGYGLSLNSIESIVARFNEDKIDLGNGLLFITVDSGITAVEEIKFIKSSGYRIIVTDHHQRPKDLPPADLFVWTDKLVGAGISWVLSRVLGSKNNESISLAALATVTDLQPVVGLNRALVKKGLEVINTSPLPGLKKLLEVSGKGEHEITAYDLGWVIGPRINASGRLIEATDSLKLFVEKDEKVLGEIAQKLNEVNTLRQDKTLEMYELASGIDENNLPKLLFSVNENYHEGIIGLVAAKLVQKYNRPSVVISLSGDYGKGSVRSVSGIDIISVLREFEDMFESLGGHPMAAGFSIEKNKIPVLENKLMELFTNRYTDADFVKQITVDIEIPISMVRVELLDEVEKMKPFGLGNEEPVFAVKQAGVTEVGTVGQERQHLLFKLFDNGQYYKAIYFNEGVLVENIKTGDKLDLIFTLKRNQYNGKNSVDLIVKDIHFNV